MGVSSVSLTVGPIGTNCYIIWDDITCKAAIIDPGGDREKIIDAINKLKSSYNIKIEWILLTHGHFDHVFLAGDLANEFSCKIGMHSADIAVIDWTMGIADMYYDMSEYKPFEAAKLFLDAETINLGESEIKVVHTPGHSPGGVCYIVDNEIFSGDTIFNGSIGRTDFPGGSYEQIISSINEKIFIYPDNYNIYPGHGGKTTVGYERVNNPYCK